MLQRASINPEAIETDEFSRSAPETLVLARRLFFRLMDLWGVQPEQGRALIQVEPARYAELKSGRGAPFTDEQVERVSYLLGIFKALQVLLPNKDRADLWVKEPNERFGGRTALDFMCEGSLERMAQVRRYLDHERGGTSAARSL